MPTIDGLLTLKLAVLTQRVASDVTPVLCAPVLTEPRLQVGAGDSLLALVTRVDDHYCDDDDQQQAEPGCRAHDYRK